MSKELLGFDFDCEFIDELSHVGVGHDDNPPGRGSGRYAYGSGKNPNQHLDFYTRVLNLRKEGLKDDEIRKMFNMRNGEEMNTSVYRAELSVGKTEYDKVMSVKAKELSLLRDDNGKKLYSNVEIADMLGVTEGTVRNYLKRNDDGSGGHSAKVTETMNLLRNQCNDKNYIDVGVGSEFWLGCSNQRMSNAARLLHETEGYELYNDIRIQQQGTENKTTFKILAPPGTPKREIYQNLDRIKLPEGTCEVWPDGEKKNVTLYGIKPPTSVDPKRVMVRYAEEGGKDKDGVMEIRRGVDDLMMGKSSYAQVRIAVGGTHYLKGMAVYSDGKDMPEGVDIIFNTNKHKDTPMMGDKDNTVLKLLKNDKDNPFGATISRQIEYKDKDGKIILSPLNIVNEEGSWGGENGWSRNVASQMLSKQPAPLIKKQLNLSYSDRVSEFDDIMMLENPVIRKKALETFADDCDATAVELKASPFPGQSWKVILPVTSLKNDEIYAPTYNDGDRVVLVRYPHGGTHEIPELTVNNKKCKEGQIILGNSQDAVGINPYVANRLSGADFDGDTVLVIPANGPNSRVKIKTRSPFEGLDLFDPKEAYPKVDGMRVMKEGDEKQREMGIISNLITDMHIKGAPDKDLAAAVRHAMVVIDAPKHELNYIQSYKDNEIEKLKQTWQKKPDSGKGYGGASTLLSRAKGEIRVNERKEGAFLTNPKTGASIRYLYDPETGEKLYSETGRIKKVALVDEKQPWVKDKNGKYVLDEEGKKIKNYILDDNGKKIYVESGEKAQIISTQMAETKDARTLSSGSKQEELYADYANKLKALANEARKASMATPTIKRNKEAAEKYEEEVRSLENKLMVSLKNAPRERQAQLVANLTFAAKKEEHPNMTKDEIKKYRQQAITGARELVGASKYRFNGYTGEGVVNGKKKGLEITDREWEAIQNGAVSNAMFSKIVANADIDYMKRLSSPKQERALSSAKIAKIKAMSMSGFTLKEIADQIGVSTTAVSKYLKGD